MKQGYNKDIYFAAIEDPQELAAAMKDKITAWRNWCGSRGLLALWARKMKGYYGISSNGNTSQAVTSGGSEGELSLIKVNDFRNLLLQQHVLVTSQRPAGIAKAVNADSTSLKSAKIGTALTEYYLGQGNIGQLINAQTEGALVCDEWFIDESWDKDAGEPIDIDETTGMAIMAGDIKCRIHAPWNVARDMGALVSDQKWYIISFRENKFDLAQNYPKFKDQIINTKEDTMPSIVMNQMSEDSDQVWCHLLIHDRTPSVQDGRYAMLVGDNIVLDVKNEYGMPQLPYKDFVVDRIAPTDVLEGCLGYSSSNDIMGLEEITDALHSAVTTNQINFSTQFIVGPKGGDFDHTDLAKGVRYFELAPDLVDKLRPMNLTQSAPETFNYINLLTQKKQEQVGSVNNTLQAQASQGASGSSMALIQAQAIQFNSGLQKSYAKLLSSVMTKVINILAKYADTPRVAKIVGKAKASGLKEFEYTGADLNSISTVIFEVTNPLSQTLGGRMDMAKDLLNAGALSGPGAAKQYVTLATTGSLDAMTQNDEARELLLIEENEWLMDGKKPTAVITEIHNDHINAHMSVLSSPKSKEDPNLVAITLQHIQEHVDLWTQATVSNPGILFATGQQPIPMPQQPAIPPQGPAPVQAPGQQPNAAEIAGLGHLPVENKADTVNQPSLPTNPLTGEQAVVPGANQ